MRSFRIKNNSSPALYQIILVVFVVKLGNRENTSNAKTRLDHHANTST